MIRHYTSVDRLFAVSLLAGCGDGGASFAPVGSAPAAPPAFIQEGKEYTFYIAGKATLATVVDIDEHAGWLKVRLTGVIHQGEREWINLAAVASVSAQ